MHHIGDRVLDAIARVRARRRGARRMLATSSVRCWLSISNEISGSSRRGGNGVAAMPERNRATWRSPHRAEPSATTSSVSEAASNVAEHRFVTLVDLGVTPDPVAERVPAVAVGRQRPERVDRRLHLARHLAGQRSGTRLPCSRSTGRRRRVSSRRASRSRRCCTGGIPGRRTRSGPRRRSAAASAARVPRRGVVGERRAPHGRVVAVALGARCARSHRPS